MTDRVVTKEISAENTYSDWLKVQKGKFNLSLDGTWDAVVTVEKRYMDDTSVVYEVDTFTQNCVKVGEESEAFVEYRFGVATGDYTSGTVVGRLSQ